MTYRITLLNRETNTRVSQSFSKDQADASMLMEFLSNIESFSGPHTLTDWDIIDIHEIKEEVDS